MQTLADKDPEAAARHAHLQRKLLKKEQRKGKAKAATFLSNVGETETDVSYRFTFTVVGIDAGTIVDAVCNSTGAMMLGGGPATTKSHKGDLKRCLCRVTPPIVAGQAPPEEELAKLAFNDRGFDDDPPQCETRKEALGSAIVYALDMSRKDDEDKHSFKEQLQMLRDALHRLRTQTRARMRPVKALLLYGSDETAIEPKSGLESWALELADFEHEGGYMWKFGPLNLQDHDLLHATFGEMTSARIQHALTGEDEELEGGVAMAEDQEGEEREAAEVSFTPSAGLCNTTRDRMSSAGSSFSEQERPPQFEAEMSGSECSETAMELHARTFGTLDALPDVQATA